MGFGVQDEHRFALMQIKPLRARSAPAAGSWI
jgi:hypothetical protein